VSRQPVSGSAIPPAGATGEDIKVFLLLFLQKKKNLLFLKKEETNFYVLW
jgi:hypothetical protein